ncbi:MAG TPA: Holliday junction branch migration protein RuvA [Candidatus Paceibacterota bacterium]|nr:Holliday junction branch migration protein RuvA [Candidatus Paceibacterota bacterium]
MIGYVEGTVRAIKPGVCIIAAGGIGYKIAATKDTLAKLKVGSQAMLWTHLAVREDALDLYGFEHEGDLSFFELLVTVPGVGPKSAIAILNVATANTLRNAIAAGNDSYLTTVSGIGKKTAQKILLELREKVGLAQGGSSAQLKSDEENLEAMRSLGYSLHEARETLKKVPAEIVDSRERLREALKILGGRS